MREAYERLIALDGANVTLAMRRAKDQSLYPILRVGTLRLAVPSWALVNTIESRLDTVVARVFDEEHLPIATFIGRDRLATMNGRLHFELRPTFTIDVELRDPNVVPAPGYMIDYARATRDVAAELEAGFRGDLRFRPDPDPAASLRASYGVSALDDRPLPDGSVRFAVGHASTALHPDGPAGLRLRCVEVRVERNHQIATDYELAFGCRYALESTDIRRLAADMRLFLSHRFERFNVVEKASGA